ncbi:hypothetical protein HPB50_018542 [Hyalomma asiaticum]|uniref:Uncharacterized protein n=1 Tax=Hyalomma asiaticum TaxID=266040 RepID=A0ACB7TIK9_HYAAI|nr:hypothetical protein HPB50_018542 [Hyalomma asiaticum]
MGGKGVVVDAGVPRYSRRRDSDLRAGTHVDAATVHAKYRHSRRNPLPMQASAIPEGSHLRATSGGIEDHYIGLMSLTPSKRCDAPSHDDRLITHFTPRSSTSP